MSKIVNEIMTRVEVSSLDESIPVYQKLTGVEEPRHLTFPEFRMAIVGPFMLLEGDAEIQAKYRRTATLIVADLTGAVESFTRHGGEVVDGPTVTPTGERTIVKDGDGNVFECFQPNAH